MATSSGPSFKTNVNRSVTRKWKEAAPVSYGGDDYGGDEYGSYDEDYDDRLEPVAGRSIVGARSSVQSSRSVTNPVPPAFEQRPDRRAFSAGGTAGFESAYPTAQRNPFPDIEHDFEPDPGRAAYGQYGQYGSYESQPGPGQVLVHARQPPLSVHTQGFAPPRPGSRSQQRASGDPAYSPLAGSYHSQPASRSSRHESPGRPDSRSSYASAHQFPPRKSSLSTAQPVIAPPVAPPAEGTTETDVQPTPTFIRPVDIYKRLEEERERERSSLDMVRPSIDLNRPWSKESSAGAPSTSSDARDVVDESDSARRLRPTLDTVVERKSEYGFDNLLKSPPQSETPDRSSFHLKSPPQSENPDRSSFHLPQIDHSSPFGSELASLSNPAVLSPKEAAEPERVLIAPDIEAAEPERISITPDIPPAVPAKDTVDHSEHGTASLVAEQANEPAPLTHQRSLVQEAVDDDDDDDDDDSQTRTPSQVSAGPLAHQTSLGYRSLVHQAFDNSQDLNPISPVSRSDTVVRSNSASTSDISPIITNRLEGESNRVEHSLAEQIIAEEATVEPGRPLSSSTLTPTTEVGAQADRLSTPPPVKIGYRRDITPPSRDNSPAKRPINVTRSEPVDKTGAVDGPAAAVIVDDHYSFGHGQTSIPDSSLSNAVTPTAVAGYGEQWPKEQPRLSPGFGLLDHKQSRPALATPILRSDSPAKGTVRQLAEKLEIQSAQSSPTSTSNRRGPSTLPSTESFRPILPGGWQSYSQSSAGVTPADERSDPFKPTAASRESETTTPTAAVAAANDPGRYATSPATYAFGTAVAGSAALAGAAALTGLGKTTTQSDDSSDDGWNNSPVTRSPERPPVDAHASKHALPALPAEHLVLQPPTEESQPPTPLPKDSPLERQIPTQATEGHAYTAGDEDYFPAPLRTAKAVDSKPTGRLSLHALPNENDDDSSPAVDHEQLQQDIVKSLTPMSSRAAGEESVSDARDNDSLDERAATTTTTTTTATAATAVAATAAVATAAAAVAATYPSPQQSAAGDLTPSSGPPQLIQRFSWEPDAAAARSLGAPATVVPSADVLSADVPSTDVPSADVPSSHIPSTDVPSTDIPSSHIPSAHVPSTDIPSSHVPSAYVPSTPPTAKTPLPETPATDPPAASASAADSSLAQSPETVRSHSQSVSSLVANSAVPTLSSPAHAQVDRSSQPIQSTDLTVRSQVADSGRGSLPSPSASAGLAQASSLSRLMEIGNHQARVEAYDHNRELYAQPDGLLEQWILSLKGYPEHADVYVPGARPPAPVSTPTKVFANRPLPSIGGGGKLMQEDGKRLMAAAGRFGGKAGGAAKGLFARGKEKLRHASASSDKGSRTTFGRLLPERSVTDASKGVSAAPVASAGAASLPSKTEPLDESAGTRQLPAEPSHPPANGVIDQAAHTPDDEADQDERPPTPPPRPSTALVPPSIDSTAQIDVESGSKTSALGASASAAGATVAAAAAVVAVAATAGTPAPEVAEPPSTTTGDREVDTLLAEPSTDAISSQQSAHAGLAVPGPTRSRSLLSEVSSATPRSAQHGDEGNQDNPISPQSPAAGSLSSIHYPFPGASKEVEPVEEQTHVEPVEEQAHVSALPGTTKGVEAADEQVHLSPLLDTSKEIEQAHLSPLPDTPKEVEPADEQAHLSPLRSHPVEDGQTFVQTETSNERPVLVRPFSFVDSLGPTVSNLSAKSIGQNVALSRSQVDRDGSELLVERQLPKTGGDSDQSTEAGEPGQLHNTTSPSPLPSARRPQTDLDKAQVVQVRAGPVEPDEEEGYRIPGPYHQEYRSPRPNTKPVPQLPQQNQGYAQPAYQPLLDSKQLQQGQLEQQQEEEQEQERHQQEQQQQEPQQQEQQQQEQVQQQQLHQQEAIPLTQQNPQSTLPPPGRRKSTISSLFRSRSKWDKHEQATSHQDSPASQSSRTGDALSQAKQAFLSRDKTTPPSAYPSAERGEAKKKRLSSLFSRGNSKRGAVSTNPPQRASTLPVHSVPPVSQIKAAVGAPYQDNNGAYAPAQQFGGGAQGPGAGYDPPPPGETTYGPSSHAPAHAPSQSYYSQQSRATALRIDTTNNGQSAYQHISTTAPAQGHARHDSSYQPQVYVPPTEPVHSQSTGIGTTAAAAAAAVAVAATATAAAVPRGPSPHVLELHKRSRSPKLGPYPADGDDDVEPVNAQGVIPVGSLGTFSNKKISPVGGVPRPDEDQEAPFRITLPGEPASDDDADQDERLLSKKALIEQGGSPTLADRDLTTTTTAVRAPLLESTTTSSPPVSTTAPATTGATGATTTTSTTTTPTWPIHKTNGNSNGTAVAPSIPIPIPIPLIAELPGSPAIGYESSDDDADLQMSATAYPGQWQDPVYFDESRWED